MGKKIKITIRVCFKDIGFLKNSREKQVRKEVRDTFKKYLERTEAVEEYLKDVPKVLPKVSNYNASIIFSPEKEKILERFGENGANIARRIFYKAYQEAIKKSF